MMKAPPDMKLLHRVLLLALLLSQACSPAWSQAPAQPFKPVQGQAGKDVVWIPSPQPMVDLMLDMARVTPNDFVIDLGSGDGRNVIGAARRGARALGVEYNPDMVALSQRAADEAGVADKARFVQGDMYKADISDATVLVLFLIPENLIKLTPRFLALKPGTRIVSNTYEISGWDPDHSQHVPGPCLSWCAAHLYIVPANVAGTWRVPDGELVLEQNYQRIWGTLEMHGIRIAVEDGAVKGDQIHFSVNGIAYAGRAAGDSIEGVAKGRTTAAWVARRAGG